MSYCKRDAGHTGPCNGSPRAVDATHYCYNLRSGAEGHQEHHAYGSRVHVPYSGPPAIGESYSQQLTESLGKACEHNDKLQAALDEVRKEKAQLVEAIQRRQLEAGEFSAVEQYWKQQVTQQAATISQLTAALEWMSQKRALTIFIEEEAHVANFFEKCDAALASIPEQQKGRAKSEWSEEHFRKMAAAEDEAGCINVGSADNVMQQFANFVDRNADDIIYLQQQVTQQAATIRQLQDLVRTLWNVGTFGMSVGNALSEDGRLRAALKALAP